MPDGKHIAKDTGAEGATLAHVAMLYYREGLTQGEIARRTGVSRATIVNWLRLAREQAIVDIRIRGESFAASPLARRLAGRFGLIDAYIAHDDAEPLTADAGARFEGLPNVILTPHIAGVTEESNVRVSDLIATRILDALA